MLTFEPARCVRSRAVASSCRACVDACPTSAISLDAGEPRGAGVPAGPGEPRGAGVPAGPGDPRGAGVPAGRTVRVELAACVDCGVCGSVCPTEAFPPVEVEARPVLRCGDGVPCVAAVSTERLLDLAKRGLRVLVGAAECRSHGAHRLAAERVERVGALIGAEIVFDDEAGETPALREPERRRFFASLVRTGTITVDRAKLDPKILRSRAVPSRRQATLAALEGRSGAVPAATADFTSSKRLDTDACTGCQRCVTVCPTGALTSSPLRDELRFEAGKCVACGLCHDVCEPRALTRGDEVALGDLGRRVVLGTLRMRPCGECNQWFKAVDDEASCPRCAAEDAEARDLLGWSR